MIPNNPTIRDYFPKPVIERNTNFSGTIKAYDKNYIRLDRVHYAGRVHREIIQQELFYKWGNVIVYFQIVPD